MSTLTRRELLRAAGGAAAMGALGARALDAAGPERPNVILILADDLSARELGCYGHPQHRTPVLDRLAESGVRFRTCWATPICSPSRAEIMTGRYGFRTGWFHNELRSPGPLCKDHFTLGQMMQRAGYATAITGKWQLPGQEAEHGFEEALMWLSGHPLAKALAKEFDGPVEQPGQTLPGRTARYWHPALVRQGKLVPTTDADYGPDRFVDFICDFATRRRDRPFFVYYPMCLPHTTWDFDRNRDGYVAPPALDANGRKTGGKGEPTLRASVEYIDHLVGRIVAHLDATGLRERTVLIFTGDNGTAGYGKGRVEEEKGPRVPMIVNGPGVVRPIGACDTLVDFSDVLPTLGELARASLPPGYVLDGKSFAPLLRGGRTREREWIFSCYATQRMVRDRRWLLDGRGRLFDCGDKRDEEGYQEVDGAASPEAAAARKRLEEVLANLPGPPEEMRRRWQERKQNRRAG